MMLDAATIRDQLCRTYCTDLEVLPAPGDRLQINTPFTFDDGDVFVIYLEVGPYGLRLTDLGHTLMQLSYVMDVDLLFEGTRGRLWESLLRTHGIVHEAGKLMMNVDADSIGPAVIRFGQALTRLTDLTFLNRVRVESTFYDDLRATLLETVPSDCLVPNYLVPELGDEASKYPVDYMVKTPRDPLFVFGIPNRDKTRLCTITLHVLNRHNVKYDSLLVFERLEDLPSLDIARLSDVGGEMISSLSAREELRRKLSKRLHA